MHASLTHQEEMGLQLAKLLHLISVQASIWW